MSLSQKTRFRIFMRDSFTCQYCGLKAPAVLLNVDHRIPRARGGTDDEGNLVTACVRCNGGKSDDLIPLEVRYVGGPFDGKTIRTTEFLPLVWVWLGTDGQHIGLFDGLADSLSGGGNHRKVNIGPSWIDHPPEVRDGVAPALRFRESDGAAGRLLGAYMPSDCYPFHHYANLDWMEPWQILLDFDFNDHPKK